MTRRPTTLVLAVVLATLAVLLAPALLRSCGDELRERHFNTPTSSS